MYNLLRHVIWMYTSCLVTWSKGGTLIQKLYICLHLKDIFSEMFAHVYYMYDYFKT